MSSKGLSEAQWSSAIQEFRTLCEEGMLQPAAAEAFLLIEVNKVRFHCCRYGGNPLPEFRTLSLAMLDAMATAAWAFPEGLAEGGSIALRCRLGEQREALVLHLSAWQERANAHKLPISATPARGTAWSTTLRLCLSARGFDPGEIAWSDPDGCLEFILDYPGKMKLSAVPGLGVRPADDGPSCWPSTVLRIDFPNRERRQKAATLVEFLRGQETETWSRC
ncbi:MAG: hypothetical protein ACRDFW_03675 [bacterium]